MFTLIIVVHLMACIALIAIVLLQTGKGAEMGAAFGGASQTLFGGSGGSSFMSKLTTAAAVIFMITCLFLSFMYRPGARGGHSVMTDIPVEQPQAPPVQPQPVVPEARPVQPEAPQQAPAGASQQPAAREQAQPQPETKAKPPVKEQLPQGQKTQDTAPAKKQ
jgi:preprotein translocase subunit SecG